jgi:protein-histidine pros-kinase
VPTDVPTQRARAAFRNLMLALGAIFVAVAVALNLMLLYTVIVPVSRLARLADRVSLGAMDVPDFHVRSRDEIRVLADSFNRMKKSLVQAMKMLED